MSDVTNVNIYVLAGKRWLKASNNMTYKTVNNATTATTIKAFTENAVTEGIYINLKVDNLNKDDDVRVKFNTTDAKIINRNPTDLRVQVPSLEKNVNTVSISVIINGLSHQVARDIKYKHPE